MYVWSKSRLRTRLERVEILDSLRWTVHSGQLHHGPGCRSEGHCAPPRSTQGSSDFSPFWHPTWVWPTRYRNYWRRGRDGRDGPQRCSCQSAGAMAGSPCDRHIYFVLEHYSVQYRSSLCTKWASRVSLLSHMILFMPCKDEFLCNQHSPSWSDLVQSRANACCAGHSGSESPDLIWSIFTIPSDFGRDITLSEHYPTNMWLSSTRR